MKLPFQVNNNTISLCLVALITLGFIIGGVFELLYDPFFLIVLISLTGIIGITVLVVLIQKSIKKNRLEKEIQDDLN